MELSWETLFLTNSMLSGGIVSFKKWNNIVFLAMCWTYFFYVQEREMPCSLFLAVGRVLLSELSEGVSTVFERVYTSKK